MLRVATYNVHGCIGRDGRHAPQRIAEVLLALDAEIIALQEITLDARGELAGYLMKRLGMRLVDGTLFARGAGQYGNVLLSRYRLVERQLHDLSVAKREPRGLLDVVVDLGGRPCNVLATHLGLTRQERSNQIERLGKLLATRAGPTLLLGDFNLWYSGRALRPLTRLGFQPSRVRSFPTWRAPLMALDRILCRNPAVLQHCWRHETPLSRVASDHYPIVADVRLAG